MGYSPPGSSVHEILQARTLEWGGIPSFRESSQPRDWTWVSCIGRWILYCLSHQGSPQYITLIPSTSIDFLSWEVKGEKIQFSYFQWRSKKIMNIKTLWKMNHCKSVFTIIRILPKASLLKPQRCRQKMPQETSLKIILTVSSLRGSHRWAGSRSSFSRRRWCRTRLGNHRL